MIVFRRIPSPRTLGLSFDAETIRWYSSTSGRIWTGPALEEQQLHRCLLDVFILYCYYLRSFLEGLFLLVSSSSANV